MFVIGHGHQIEQPSFTGLRRQLRNQYATFLKAASVIAGLSTISVCPPAVGRNILVPAFARRGFCANCGG
jgi:hypothetical protein